MGERREEASVWSGWGGTLLPARERRLTVVKTPWALERVLDMCGEKPRLGVNQNPSHRTTLAGETIDHQDKCPGRSGGSGRLP